MTSADDKNKKYVLVTGGAGYIGSHTCKMLHQKGYMPVAFDNLSNGHAHAVQWGPFVKGDLQNLDDIRAVFKAYNFISVIHFASFIEVGESVQDPEKYYRNNVGGALNLLQVMREHKVSDIIFSSTCAVYGEPEKLPISEDTARRPINPYGQSKLMVEYMLEDFAAAYDLKFVICRYFNACGADVDGDIGEEHDPETHIIPIALQVANGTRDAFHIFGNDYATPDGTCVRDYIHVQDLATAHIAALEYLQNEGENLAVNLGTGTGYSVQEILDSVCAVTGKNDFAVSIDKRRVGDPPILVADTRKAQEILGFKTQVSDLETIISTAWNFSKQIKK